MSLVKKGKKIGFLCLVKKGIKDWIFMSVLC